MGRIPKKNSFEGLPLLIGKVGIQQLSNHSMKFEMDDLDERLHNLTFKYSEK